MGRLACASNYLPGKLFFLTINSSSCENKDPVLQQAPILLDLEEMVPCTETCTSAAIAQARLVGGVNPEVHRLWCRAPWGVLQRNYWSVCWGRGRAHTSRGFAFRTREQTRLIVSVGPTPLLFHYLKVT